jgi:hypothetical protein
MLLIYPACQSRAGGDRAKMIGFFRKKAATEPTGPALFGWLSQSPSL